MYVKRGQLVGSNGFINPYFKRKLIVPKNGWNYYRLRGKKTLSQQAQLKLEWIIFYHTAGGKSATTTASHFCLTRKTFHKCLTRFDEGNLSSLEEQKRTPLTNRQWMVTRI